MVWIVKIANCGYHKDYLSVLLSFFLLSMTELVEAEGSTCLHRYIEQLRYNPNCNPFDNGLMRLECVAEIPLNATDITIGWFFDCNQLNDGMMVDAAQVSIEPQVIVGSEVRRLRSRLTISDISNAFAGDYTCNLLGNNEYIPSDKFHLPEEMDFDYLFVGPCSDGDVLTMHGAEKCADITENMTIPVSLICEDTPSTSSHTAPTSTPILSSTPSLVHTSSTSSASSTSIPTVISPTNSPTTPAPSVGIPSPSEEETTSTSSTQDPTSVWLYVVVAVAAVFFMIIIVLAIVCVGMCIRRTKSFDIQTPTSPVSGKHLPGMTTNTSYEGENYPDSVRHDASPPPPLPQVSSSPYNTLEGDYETIGPGSNYHRLERPTLKSGLMSRFGSNPDTIGSATTMTSVYPISATPTKHNGAPFGAVPPPLPSMGPPSSGASKSIYSPESSFMFESAFHSGTVDVSSPMERDRMDSTSLLLPRDRKESSTSTTTGGGFEDLYHRRGQRNSPPSPLTGHPLHKIPETPSFPEPSNPHPFPMSSSCTYESIPENESTSSISAFGASYEKPLPSPKKSRDDRAVTLPASPPPAMTNGEGTSFQQNDLTGGRSVTLSPRGYQEIELQPGPVYQRLESPHHSGAITNGAPAHHPPPPPLVETADFTADSETSGTNTLTPGFPVVSADFADIPADKAFPMSKQRPQRRQLANNLSSDCTGDSDYPQLEDFTDCTGGSTISAYAETDWTGGSGSMTAPAAGTAPYNFLRGPVSQANSSAGSGRTITPSSESVSAPSHSMSGSESNSSRYTSQNNSLSNRDTQNSSTPNGSTYSSEPTSEVPNGSCTMVAQFPHVPPGSSHTVPVSNGTGNNHVAGGAPSSHTISTPRNHYKKLDPATIEPQLKYTRLHVGKLTAV